MMNNLEDLEIVIGLLRTAFISDKEKATEIVKLAHKYLSDYLVQPKTIEDMGKIYTEEGYVAAIKEWKAITGKGLKEAKDDIAFAINKYNWPHPLLGKTMIISSTDDRLHGRRCVVRDIRQGEKFCRVNLFENDYSIDIEVCFLRET